MAVVGTDARQQLGQIIRTEIGIDIWNFRLQLGFVALGEASRDNNFIDLALVFKF